MAELPKKEKLDELEALAKATVLGSGDRPNRPRWPNMEERGDWGSLDPSKANFEFIAAASPEVVLSLIAAARRLESATAHHDEHHKRDDERWAKAQEALGLQAAWPALFDRMRELVAAQAELDEWQTWGFSLGKPPITDDASLRAQLQDRLETLALYRCGDTDPASGAECTRLKGHLSERHWDGAGHHWGEALFPSPPEPTNG